MEKYIITKEMLEDVRKGVVITSNLKQKLKNTSGCNFIKICEIKKLFVETGGTSFDHLFSYDEGDGLNSGVWRENWCSNLFYSHFQGEHYRGVCETDLSKKIIQECLDRMTYPSIGIRVYECITNSKNEKKELTQTYVPFSLVMDMITITTKGDYCIIGSSEDLEEIQNIQLNCMDYFEEVIS
jgi:hypothetical protein